jgi:glycosyltransferase involved in cell wall biosynthesis
MWRTASHILDLIESVAGFKYGCVIDRLRGSPTLRRTANASHAEIATSARRISTRHAARSKALRPRHEVGDIVVVITSRRFLRPSAMATKAPRVSIGMPVRNGQRYIRQALDSLLAQTFGDFELIICDNASTDATELICREYQERDVRVRYFRNERDLGPAGNHNKCVNLSRGQYFRWHAHDDVCEPTYLERCVAALDADPTVVIAYPRTMIIDEQGEAIEAYDFHPATDRSNVAQRFSQLVMVNHRKHRAVEIFGLMRVAALLQTPLEGAYARGDSVLLARMALLGRFVELPDRLFLSRCHATQSMQTLPTFGKGVGKRFTRFLGTGPLPPPEWWDASRKGKISFPEWNLMKQYWVSINRPPLTVSQRLRCRAVVLKWVLCNLPKLVRDMIFAAENVSTKVIQRVLAAPVGENVAPAGHKS